MKNEVCFGVVPYKKEEGEWKVLFLLHKKGEYWGFPKGHAESGESPFQAAVRELEEETGLQVVKLLTEDLLSEEYEFLRKGKLIHKQVTYFQAEVKGEVNCQTKEILDSRWVKMHEAEAFSTYPCHKALCRLLYKP